MHARRAWATPLGDGLYEVPISLPWPGIYRVYVEAAGAGITDRDLPNLSLLGRQQEG